MGTSQHLITKSHTHPDMQAVNPAVVQGRRYNLPRGAFQRVKRNKEAAGIDHMTVEGLYAHLQDHGRKLWQCLLQGEWRPAPVRRVLIPEPDGGERQLGIPTALDRIREVETR